MSKDTAYISCEICHDLVLTKRLDKNGNKITKIQCWNCISNEIEEINSGRFLERVKDIGLKKISILQNKKTAPSGIMKKVFDKLKDEFILNELYEAYIEAKKEMGIEVIRCSKNRTRVVFNYTRYWIKAGKIEKIGIGKTAYFRKIPT